MITMAGYYERTPEIRARQSAAAQARSHGQVRTGAYRSWYAMKQRCTNPNNKEWPRYGGQGVTIHPDWLEFTGFYADMGDRPPGRTLDRIDNTGNYEPGNCRWASHVEQRLNQVRPPLRRPDCHPDRKHVARGLCGQCYEKARGRRRGIGAFNGST